MDKCINCGKELDGKKRSYCCLKCKKAFIYKNNKYIKKCKICNKEFIARVGESCCSKKCNLKAQRIHRKKCIICGKVFNSRGNGVYCSNSCYRLANDPYKGLIEKECIVCGAKFKVLKKAYNNTISCSKECENKEKEKIANDLKSLLVNHHIKRNT